MREKSENKVRSNFLVQGSILALAGILVRIIGLLYRIPLRRIVGKEGIGYYSFAFSVYAIILLLSSYSLPLAVSKMVSAKIAANDRKNAGRIFKAAILYASVVGGLGCALLYFGSDFFARTFFKAPYSLYALKTLAPTVWVMAYLGVFRGYYQGHSTMIPTAASQLLEQIVNAIVSILAAKKLSEHAIRMMESESKISAYGAAGGTIGTGAGALFALFLLLGLFLYHKRKGRGGEEESGKAKESYAEITGLLFLTVIPVILSTAIYNINGIIDGAVFGNVMDFLGRDPAHTASEYGVYTGEYLILINVPVAISNALASSLIPTLTRASAAKKTGEISQNITDAIRFSMLIAMPAAVGLAILAEPIYALLFASSGMSVAFMRWGSLAVVFSSLSTVSNAILQGTNHMGEPVKNAALSLLIHIAVLILSLFYMGAYALVFANILFVFLICVLNALSIKRFLRYRQEFRKIYLMPALSSLLMGGIVFLFFFALKRIDADAFLLCALPIAFGGISYPFILLLTRTLKEKELRAMPGGKRLSRICKKLRLCRAEE